MLHMMRQIVDNDEKWRCVLRGLNATFWHHTVTGAQIQAYINKQSGVDFTKVFEQYQTTPRVPVLEYKIVNGGLSYRWTDVVPGFAMPVKAGIGDTTTFGWLKPTESWAAWPKPVRAGEAVKVDPNFYVLLKNASAP